MKHAMTLLLLLVGAQAWAMEPPEMEWGRQYFVTSDYTALFRYANLTSAGDFILAGRANGLTTHAYLFCMDCLGDTLWTNGNGSWYYHDGYCVANLTEGCFAVTGACHVESSSSWGLFISKVDASGIGIWSEVYDCPGSTERGYGITTLPDDGFCVTGVNYSSGVAQAWILRTDSEGDTLWTDLWGYSTPAYAKQALCQDGELIILVRGFSLELPTTGIHLLFYDLDGNYLRGTSYPGIGGHASDICHAPDGGFTFITTGCIMVHTDDLGNLLWVADHEQTDADYSNSWSSISSTMDGGYIVSGRLANQSIPMEGCQESPRVLDTQYQYMYGWLLRFDSEGSLLWEILLNPGGGDEVEFYSARQLMQGGYIASGYYNDVGGTGVDGYIVRYAPETGIGEWESSSGESASLSAWPNPSVDPVSISLSGPEGLYGLGIYDLQGRRVREYPEDPAGRRGNAALGWQL